MTKYLLALILVLWSLPAHADDLPDPGDIKQVRVVGPSWENFTNQDGTGLYHEILIKVFGLYGIEYVRDYVPSERAYHLVRTEHSDMMTCHDKPPRGLTLARHPLYEGLYYVFFNRKNIGEWKLPDSLKDRTIVWRIGYYDPNNIPAPMKHKEVKTGISALGMVLLGRMDFYLDDLNFIEDSLKANKIDFDMEDFRIEPIGRRTYHPVLNTTPRGRKIKELYDAGMEHLYRTGELQKIYDKWGFPMPHFIF